MTPQLLFDNFERLADAPDAIPKLRAMILQLAVQGKLVPQDPDDEPASVLLEKIASEKERLIKEEKIRKTEPLSPIRADEIPYEVPEGWEWIRLGDCVDLISGQHLLSNEYNEEERGIPYLTGPADFGIAHPIPTKWTENPKVVARLHDLLLTVKGAGIGKTNIVNTDALCISRQLMAIRTLGANQRCLHIYIQSQFGALQNMGLGIAIPGIGRKDVLGLLLPLSPFSEQERIVAKVDQLMALCDELEERKKRRDEGRVNLNAACLHELTSPEPQKSRKAWKRIQSHFDLLYETPANVAALRKSILQLAVMGRLAPQDPSDEPASALIEKIAAEKERLIKEGKIKKGKPLAPIRPDEVPYEVPEGWVWVRLGDLIHVTSGQALPRSKMSKGSIPVFGGNGITGYHNEANVEALTIVIGRVGFYCGSIHETPKNAWITDNAFITAFPENFLFRAFVVWLLRATNLRKNDSATAQPVISGSKIYPLLIPLPPLPEQKRIVAKVDRLMTLCDQLESQLAQLQRDCDALLSAIVNHIETVTQSSCQE